MKPAKRHDRLTEVLREIETYAKRLRSDVRRAARQSGLAANLERAAKLLRARAAVVAALVEKFARDVRIDLSAPVRRPAARRRMRRAA
jgi:hypothetical protein